MYKIVKSGTKYYFNWNKAFSEWKDGTLEVVSIWQCAAEQSVHWTLRLRAFVNSIVMWASRQ